ncbi:MAG: hypothetical protein KF875_10670 [Trueperaceae bacterium]|nr:hypothetical protein [Trueperaceae bacterium]MCW5818322.1 hypothetical protein [Trueperaceae bacterium]
MTGVQTENGAGANGRVGFGEVWRAILRGAPFAMLAVVAAIIVSVLVTRSMAPTYEASVTLLAARPPASFSTFDIITPATVDPRVYQRVLQDGSIVRDALYRLDGVMRSEAEIVRFRRNMGVGIENQEISSVIHVSIKNSDPQLAADQANAIAMRLIEWDRDRARLMFDNSIAALEQAIAETDQEIARIVAEGGPTSQSQQALAAALREQRVRELEAARARGASAVMVGLLEMLNRAEPPVEAIGPRLIFNTLVAVVLAGFLAYAAQLALWAWTDEVGSRGRLEAVTGVPVLAVLARRRGQARSLSGDAVSYLRAGILKDFATNPKDSVVFGLTAPKAFGEKSGIALALAESLARTGFRCIALDADLRRRGPGLGIAPSRGNEVGIENYLRNAGDSLEVTAVAVESEIGFDALPAVAITKQASELLGYGLAGLLEALRQEYDVILIDLPPVLAFADALVAAPLCDGVILCVDVKSKSSLAADSVNMLEGFGGRVLGTVLTGLRAGQSGTADRARVVRTNSGVGGQGAVDHRTKPPSSRIVARVKQRE